MNNNFVDGVTYRISDEVVFDKVFPVNGNEELCHHTGFEKLMFGQWWYEYEDSEGELHYGR